MWKQDRYLSVQASNILARMIIEILSVPAIVIVEIRLAIMGIVVTENDANYNREPILYQQE